MKTNLAFVLNIQQIHCMAVIKLVDKIVNAANNNEITAGIFLDLSKAFDTIKHDILLDKMAHLRISWYMYCPGLV